MSYENKPSLENTLLLADFTAAAHEAYAVTYDEYFSRSLPDAFQDKPLQFVRLDIVTNNEILQVSPLTVANTALQQYHPDYETCHQDVLQRHQQLALHIAGTSLRSGLDIRQLLPAEGVVPVYHAMWENSPQGHVSRFMDKPDSGTLTSGIAFTKRAIRYSDQHTQPLERHFNLVIDPNLPLNGHESKLFLMEFASHMQNRVSDFETMIVQAGNHGNPTEHGLMYLTAQQRAQKARDTACAYLQTK